MKQINDLYADVVKALSKSSNKLTRKVKRATGLYQAGMTVSQGTTRLCTKCLPNVT